MSLAERPKRSLLALAVVGTVLMMVTSTSAMASESDDHDPTPPPQEITFSVLGDIGEGVGSSVSLQELSALGIDLIPGEGVSAPPGSYGVEGARAGNNVMFRWNDFGGRTVVLRSITYNKIMDKHNLTYRTPRAVTQHASTRTWDGGSSWRYRLVANEVTCDFWGHNCKVVRAVTVRTIVDFRPYDRTDSLGVVTAYCEGIVGRCPDFVKNALNQ